MSSSSSQIQVRVLPEDIGNPKALRAAVNRQLRMQGKAPLDEGDEPRILRQSWDARRRPVQAQLLVDWGEEKAHPTWTWSKLAENAPSVIVVGAGPAGLYAALECIQLGVRPVVLERGKDVYLNNGLSTMSPTDHNGYDERSAFLIKVEGGKFRLVK